MHIVVVVEGLHRKLDRIQSSLLSFRAQYGKFTSFYMNENLC